MLFRSLVIGQDSASFMLTNYGFAAPYGYELKIYVDGNIVNPTASQDCNDLVQFSQQIYTVPYTCGEISIAIVNKRDPSDCIRLLNDIPFTDGRNVILTGATN